MQTVKCLSVQISLARSPQCSTQLKVFLKLTHNVQNDDQLLPFIADSLDPWSHGFKRILL